MFNIYRGVIASELEDEEEISIDRRVLQDTTDPFSLEESDFLEMFRLTKTVVMNLIHRIQHRLDPPSGPKTYIPAYIKVSYLFFYVNLMIIWFLFVYEPYGRSYVKNDFLMLVCFKIRLEDFGLALIFRLWSRHHCMNILSC